MQSPNASAVVTYFILVALGIVFSLSQRDNSRAMVPVFHQNSNPKPKKKLDFSGFAFLVGLILFAIQQGCSVTGNAPSWIWGTVWFSLAIVLVVLAIWFWDQTASHHWIRKLVITTLMGGVMLVFSYISVARQYRAEHAPHVQPGNFVGIMLPANDPDPLPDCKAKKGEMKVVLGTSGWVGTVGNLVKVSDRNWVRVKPFRNGISIDASFTGEDQNILGTITDSRFVLNPYNAFDVRTPDDSTLIVHSIHDGSEILNVRFSNPTMVRINGVFYLGSGRRIEINDKGINSEGFHGSRFDHVCFFNTPFVQITPPRIGN